MSTPFSGYDDVDDLTVLGSAINNHKSTLNTANVTSAARLKIALSGAIASLVDAQGGSAEIKVTTRTKIQNTLAEVLENRGLEGLGQVLHLTSSANPATTPVASLGAGTGMTTPDPVDPETARKLALADTFIAACGGNINNAERNVKPIALYLPNPQFMRYVEAVFADVNDPKKTGAYVMNDPATGEVVLSTTYNAEQGRVAYRDAFEALLAGVFGAGKLPSGDHSKQLPAALAKLSSMSSTTSSTEADELYKLITSKEAHDPKKETVPVYLARVEGLLQTMGARTALTETGKKVGLDWSKDATGKVIESPEDFMNRIAAKVGGDNIGDFLNKIGGDAKIGMPRNAGESDRDYAERIFKGAAALEWTYNKVYNWLLSLGLTTDALKNTNVFDLFVVYINVHNAGVDHFNSLSSVKKAAKTLKKHPVPTAS